MLNDGFDCTYLMKFTNAWGQWAIQRKRNCNGTNIPADFYGRKSLCVHLKMLTRLWHAHTGRRHLYFGGGGGGFLAVVLVVAISMIWIPYCPVQCSCYKRRHWQTTSAVDFGPENAAYESLCTYILFTVFWTLIPAIIDRLQIQPIWKIGKIKSAPGDELGPLSSMGTKEVSLGNILDLSCLATSMLEGTDYSN